MTPLKLDSQVMVAAGCGGTGRELAPYAALERLLFVTRSLTLTPRLEGPAARLQETPSGLVCALSPRNSGVLTFLEYELPWLVRAGVQVYVSLVGSSLGEYADLARVVGGAPGVAGVEVNISTPDPSGAGFFDAREPFHAGSVAAAVRREVPGDLPVLVKLRPDVFRGVETARAVSEAGATAVVLGNALPAALRDGSPAGLSGPALRPVSLRCVNDVARALPSIPVIGAGGIASTADAREFLGAGAVAVQVGTALLHDPTTVSRIVRDLEEPQ